jgi:putative aldouronate transport system substrate-binding protein
MKMKKCIALLLSTAMTLGLAACGGGAADSQTAAAPSASGVAAETNSVASDGEYPVIRWAYTRMFNTDSEAAVEEEMNEILRETCQAQIDLVPIDFASMQQQFNLLLSGGSDSIDVFSSFWYMPLATLHANGQIADLTELLEQYPEVMDLFADYPEVMECCKIDGKIYALPTVAAYSSPMLYLCKETDSKSANIDWSQVKTLDDVTEAMLAMKAVNPDNYYVPGATETYWVPKDIDYLADENFFGVLTDPLNSTTVENYYESDYFMNFLDNVKIWQENGIITPDPMSNTNPNLMSLQVGLASGTPGYSFDIDEFCYEANIQQQYGDNLVGAQLGDRLITTGNVSTYLWHITSFSQNKEAAMRVLAAFYTDTRLCDLLGNGIEGENYVLNGDGTIGFPEGKDSTNCGWTGLGATYMLPNASGAPVWYYQPTDLWQQYADSNKVAKPSLALGFTFDATSVADQVTACSNVYAQYYLPLINGEVDIDEVLPVFQQALHDAGIDDIIAEKQAQLDKWLASK